MPIAAFDHVAIPIERVDEMLEFYRQLGFEVRQPRPPLMFSVHLADQKINFHGPELWKPGRFTLRGPSAAPGCGDFCFRWDGAVSEVVTLLAELDIPVIEGPVDRDGGRHGGDVGTSVYIRDPDQNLLEFICY